MPNLTETFASYVPVLITLRLAQDPVPITEPTSHRFDAALFYADISGFTALTEGLAQEGPGGAERLTGELNTYFGQLIELIHGHGGDVVSFAGDGLTAIWPVSDAEEADLAVRARQATGCAQAIQTALRLYRTTNGTRLALRIGLGAGQIKAVHVGGVYGRWEFTITGSPLRQVEQAEGQARAGQTIVSPQMWELIEQHCEGQQRQDGYVQLAGVDDGVQPHRLEFPVLSPQVDASLRAYIPAAIRTRLEAGQSGWLAELRRVTVLFINLPDLTYDTTLLQIQDAMQLLQKALYHYEGSVNKISVDNKGTTLVAAMGLPPFAHEDDAVRGVEAAMRVQAVLKERLNWRCAIGITTGRAFCGSVGTEKRREYTIMGNVVNLAARLMQAADAASEEKAILCDETTYRVVGSRTGLEALPPIRVKGWAKRVPVYRPRQGTTAQQSGHIGLFDSPMVGRAEERRELAETIQGLQAGHNRIVVIEGEAGIGKSRLVADLLQQIQDADIQAFVGAGDAVERTVAYHAWRPVFVQLFEVDAEHEEAEVLQSRVRSRVKTVDEELLSLLPLLNAVLPLHLTDNELTAQMSGKLRADNTQHLLVRLLQAMAEDSATVLVLEDAHWLDSASWALLSRVRQQVEPLLLVLATRPMAEPVPREYTHLCETALRLCLEPLLVEDALDLVCQRLGVTSVPDAVADLIRQKAEGHPFFSEELAYALRDNGLIQIVDGSCQLAPGVVDFRDLVFPNSVEGVITSRIDRLSPQQQLTLKVASAIGRIFAYRLLYEVYPIENDRPRLRDCLDELEHLDLTPLETPEPELSYIFKHVITQDVAYNLMAFSQRRNLHQAIAEWLERTQSEDLTHYYPLLAYHWSNALGVDPNPEHVAKAVHYLMQAGDEAQRISANQESLRYYQQALALTQEEDTYHCILAKRGQVYSDLFQGPEALSDFQRLLNRARQVGAREQELEALLGMGRAQYVIALDDQKADAADKSWELYAAAYAVASELEDKRGMARALIGTRYHYMWSYDYLDQTAANIREAKALDEDLGDTELISDSEMALSLFSKPLEWESEAVQLLRRLEDQGDLTRTNELYFLLTYCYILMGNLERAMECTDAATRVAAILGVPPVLYPSLKAQALVNLGQYGAAWTALQQEVVDDAHPFARAFRDYTAGTYLLDIMACEKALATFEDVIRQADQLNRPWLKDHALVQYARGLALSRPSDSEELGRMAKDLADLGITLPTWMVGQPALARGEIALALEQYDEALRHVGDAIVEAEEDGRRLEHALAMELQGRVLYHLDSPAEAIRSADVGLKLATAMGNLPTVWRLWGTKGEALRRHGKFGESARAFQVAATVIRKLSDTIPDGALQQGFLSNPRVSSILAVSQGDSSVDWDQAL